MKGRHCHQEEMHFSNSSLVAEDIKAHHGSLAFLTAGWNELKSIAEYICQSRI